MLQVTDTEKINQRCIKCIYDLYDFLVLLQVLYKNFQMMPWTLKTGFQEQQIKPYMALLCVKMHRTSSWILKHA